MQVDNKVEPKWHLHVSIYISVQFTQWKKAFYWQKTTVLKNNFTVCGYYFWQMHSQFRECGDCFKKISQRDWQELKYQSIPWQLFHDGLSLSLSRFGPSGADQQFGESGVW